MVAIIPKNRKQGASNTARQLPLLLEAMKGAQAQEGSSDLKPKVAAWLNFDPNSAESQSALNYGDTRSLISDTANSANQASANSVGYAQQAAALQSQRIQEAIALKSQAMQELAQRQAQEQAGTQQSSGTASFGTSGGGISSLSTNNQPVSSKLSSSAGLAPATSSTSAIKPKTFAGEGDGNFAKGAMTDNSKISTGSSARDTVLSAAKSQLGVPYSWGGGGGLSRGRTGATTGIAQGSGTKGFDCSGLVDYAFSKIGKAVGNHTYSQVAWAAKHGKIVPQSQLKPGDIVFGGSRSAPHHVAVYWGKGKILEAMQTGTKIHITPMRKGQWGIALNY